MKVVIKAGDKQIQENIGGKSVNGGGERERNKQSKTD